MDFIDSLFHYLFPRHSNDHKAKILHASSLLLISALLLSFQLALNFIPKTGVKILGYAANISTDEVVRLTNQKRVEAGVPTLRYNASLAQAALAKGNHMLANQYWAHIAPDGTEPWKFFTDVGYRYRYAGENLARDFTNPTAVVDAWMASPTHRDNLLSNKYADIGVAVVEGNLNGIDTTIIVQFFGSPLGEPQPIVAKAKAIISPTPVNIEPASAAATLVTIALTPTPIVVGNVGIETIPPIQKESSRLNVLLSPFQTTRGISIAITILLIIVFFIDLIVVFRKRLPRNSSRTFAHIAFLGMILAIIILAKAGKIL
jgi:uncharacterized protein YkwD